MIRHLILIASLLAAACGHRRGAPEQQSACKHIILGADLDAAVDDKLTAIADEIDASLRAQKIAARVTTSRSGTIGVALEAAGPAEPLGRDYADVLEQVSCPAEAGLSLCYRLKPAFAEAVRAAALEEVVRTISNRLHDSGGAGTVARKDEDHLEVKLGAASPAELKRREEMVTHRGQVAVLLVDDADPLMARIAERVGRNPDEAPGIQVVEDRWTTPEGDERSEVTLTARDFTRQIPRREGARHGCCLDARSDADACECTTSGQTIIRDYLKTLGPDYAPDPEHVIESGEVQPGVWQARLLLRRNEIPEQMIAGAKAEKVPLSEGVTVFVLLTADGGRRLRELTSASVGRKVAILIDRRIALAPVIREPVTAARIGVGEYEAAEADALAIILRDPLPVPTLEMSSEPCAAR
jgi:preprotein translocase subunit SecD